MPFSLSKMHLSRTLCRNYIPIISGRVKIQNSSHIQLPILFNPTFSIFTRWLCSNGNTPPPPPPPPPPFRATIPTIYTLWKENGWDSKKTFKKIEYIHCYTTAKRFGVWLGLVLALIEIQKLLTPEDKSGLLLLIKIDALVSGLRVKIDDYKNQMLSVQSDIVNLLTVEIRQGTTTVTKEFKKLGEEISKLAGKLEMVLMGEIRILTKRIEWMEEEVRAKREESRIVREENQRREEEKNNEMREISNRMDKLEKDNKQLREKHENEMKVVREKCRSLQKAITQCQAMSSFINLGLPRGIGIKWESNKQEKDSAD